MDLKKLVLSTITVAAFSLCFLAPAFAAEPHLSQKEALAKFNAMHLPDMPVEMAKETRGGGFFADFALWGADATLGRYCGSYGLYCSAALFGAQELVKYGPTPTGQMVPTTPCMITNGRNVYCR